MKKNPLGPIWKHLHPRDPRTRIPKGLLKCLDVRYDDPDPPKKLRLIKYAWPGGYQVIYITKGGNVLCPDCAQAELDTFLDQDDDSDYGWPSYDPVVGCQGFEEGPSTYCEGCGKEIESDYGDPDDPGRKPNPMGPLWRAIPPTPGPGTPLDRDEQFFYDHGGWSYDPKTETSEQGRRRIAIRAARNEREAKKRGWYVEWEYEDEPVEDLIDRTDWTDEENEKWDAEEHEVLRARVVVEDEDGNDIGEGEGLGGIVDPDPDYKRVIEAELFEEALAAEEP